MQTVPSTTHSTTQLRTGGVRGWQSRDGEEAEREGSPGRVRAHA